MLGLAIQKQIEIVFNAFGVRTDAVVLMCVDPKIDKRMIKPLLDAVLSWINEGSLCIIGDCSFNTNELDIECLKSLSNQERMVLAADYPLQLLSLREDSVLARHPSLSMGGIGKMARFIFRHTHLDFPYDKPSVFSDLESLNALYVCIGDVKPKFALKYACASNDDRIVEKETCVYNGKILSYLDYEVDYSALETQFNNSSAVVYNAEGPLDIYAGWYANIIRDMK